MQKKIMAIIMTCALALGMFAFTGCAGDGAGNPGDTKVTLEFNASSDIEDIESPLIVTFDALDTTELWQYAAEISTNDLKNGSATFYVPSTGEYVIEIVTYVDANGNIYNINVDPLFDATGEDITLDVDIMSYTNADAPDDIKQSEYERVIMSLDRVNIIDNNEVSQETIDTITNNVIRSNGGQDPRARYSAIGMDEPIELDSATAAE